MLLATVLVAGGLATGCVSGSGSPAAPGRSALASPRSTTAAVPTPSPVAILVPALAPTPAPTPPPRPEPEIVTADMRLDVAERGEAVPSVVLLAKPGERLEFRGTLTKPASAGAARRPSGTAGGVESSRKFLVDVTAGTFDPTASGGIAWTAPEAPGLQTLTFRLSESSSLAAEAATTTATAAGALPRERVVQATREVRVLVEARFDRSGKGDIDGYPIGIYPNENGKEATPAVARKPEAFAPPQWFVRVAPETEGLLVAPHFTLGEFAPRSERGQVCYIALEQRLIDFLEALRTEVQAAYGSDARVTILRAYMSPNEHRRLEQKGAKYATFTRYQYGDSAAIVVDTDGSGRMGDLNRDGKVDRADADALAEAVDRVQTAQKKAGWLASFEKPVETDWPQTPFVAFDLRGIKVRQ